MRTAHIVGGNHVTSFALSADEQVEARFYVSGVDVSAPQDTAIGVAFGDSWFEGVGSTTDGGGLLLLGATGSGDQRTKNVLCPECVIPPGTVVTRKSFALRCPQ
jgi:hypothetical protein